MKEGTKKYSNEELDFIKNNYQLLSDEEIAVILNRPIKGISERRKRMGLFRYFQESAGPLKNEIWKPYDYVYEISNKGRVRKNHKHILSPQIHITGYVYISIHGKQQLVHRLVYIAFNGMIEYGYEINHKDCNKQNNSLYNLECVTHSENMKHAYDNNCFNNFFGRS